MLSLTPVSAAPVPCKICGEAAPIYGTVDFNRNCEIAGGVKLPSSGTPVRYRRCPACGFLFTDAFDRWSQEQFKTHIYNEGYAAVDPEYAESRPRNNAAAVVALFGAHRSERRVLDYGGGNDALCAQLRMAGFPVAVTYDPFVPDFATRPPGKFDLITCFETLEHMPDPVAGVGDIVTHLDEPGLVLFPRCCSRRTSTGTGWAGGMSAPATGTFPCSAAARSPRPGAVTASAPARSTTTCMWRSARCRISRGIWGNKRVIKSPLTPAKAGVQRWVPAFAGTSGMRWHFRAV